MALYSKNKINRCIGVFIQAIKGANEWQQFKSFYLWLVYFCLKLVQDTTFRHAKKP